MTAYPYVNFTNSGYTYLKIAPTGLAINGVENGVTSIYIGSNQNYYLTPTNYSYDLDQIADFTNLNYKYYCRTIDLTSNVIDNSTMTDLNTYQINPSLSMDANQNCFSSSSTSINLFFNPTLFYILKILNI